MQDTKKRLAEHAQMTPKEAGQTPTPAIDTDPTAGRTDNLADYPHDILHVTFLLGNIGAVAPQIDPPTVAKDDPMEHMASPIAEQHDIHHAEVVGGAGI